MLFCKEPTCKSLAVVGGYCLSHQLERANELYAQLDQRNDSCSRMSREITERIANESKLTQRAEAAEARAEQLAAQLATAEIPCLTCGGSGFSKPGSGYDAVCDDCTGGYVGYATGEMVNNLYAQLETAQAALERVTLERDNALAHIESYLEKFDDSSLSDDFVKRWLDNSWIPQSRRLI